MEAKPVTDPFGIDHGYHDAAGRWCPASEETCEALRAAIGDDPETARAARATVVVRQGDPIAVGGRAELILEDGCRIAVEGTVTGPLPHGYHSIDRLDGRPPARLVVGPRRCHQPESLRIWAWAVQLYALRSRSSWGIGDLADLRDLARWSKDLGAGMLLLNPLVAATPVLPQQPSPYYPTSRCYGNPLYLRIEEVPGARESGVDLDRIASAGRLMLADRRIDRDAIFRLKHDALARIWSRVREAPPSEFEAYVREHGELLSKFATFCAIAESFGRDWREWPSELRRPDAPRVRRFVEERRDRVRHHSWLQWLLDGQLAAAAAELPLMQDLPIGVDPGGADAWVWQDALASGVSVGAPPDLHNSSGQNWGLPPFSPPKLRAAGYEPFVRTIRATLRRARGLRIDHVMGLFRLFWIPYGAGSRDGTYVRYPADDLLTIVALESERAAALVVGEDLGTVEDGVRETLRAAGILSYRLLWFESGSPEGFPVESVAAVTTHDLPTIAGVWTGSDLRDQAACGSPPSEELERVIRDRLRERLAVTDGAPVESVVEGVHRMLAEAPSAIRVATLDDALAAAERPNMPGENRWPSWSIALPATLEELQARTLPRAIAAALSKRTSSRSSP
jgi:4-alpha-glucanotransferase